MTPITREEYFLAKINGDDVSTPAPVTRVEKYYDIIAGNDGAILPPVTREEFFLAKIAGLDIAVPEPETRIEIYLAIIAGADLEAPEPETRKEFYLAIWAEDKPETHTGTIVAFVAKKVKPMQIKAQLEPVQDLHGYDAPWPPGGGVNKWDEEWEAYGESQIKFKNRVKVTPGATYFWHGQGATFYQYETETGSSVSFQNVSKDSEFTIPSGVNYVMMYTGSAYGNVYNHDLSLNFPASYTDYFPYSNLCPITGHTGVTVYVSGTNQWDEEWEVGSYTASGGNGGATDRIRCKNYIPALPNTNYYLCAPSGNYVFYLFFDSEKNALQTSIPMVATNTVVTSPAKTAYMLFYMSASYGTTYNNDISINYPSSDTSYHAYTGNTYPISWQSEAGAVYDGSISIFEDGSGVLTAEWAVEDIKNYTFSAGNRAQNIGGKYFFLERNENICAYTISDVSAAYANEKYSLGVVENPYTADKSCMWTYQNGTKFTIRIGLPNSFGIDTSEKLSTFLADQSNVQILYPLATPIVYNLTAEQVGQIMTLKGNNVVWVDDSDEIEVVA